MSTPTHEHDDLSDLLGAYALGAVDEVERAAIERRLEVDVDARRKADALARGALLLHTDDGPSPDVWDSIVDRLESGEHRAPGVAALAGIRAHRTRPARGTRIAAAVAAVAAAALVAVVATTGPDSPTLPEPRTSPVEAAARRALGVEGAERVALVSEDGSDRVDVVVLPDGSGYVLGSTLADSAGEAYRLLAVTDHGTVLVSMLGTDIEPTAFQLPADSLGMVIARGDSVVASGAVPAALQPAPTTLPTAAPGASAPPPPPGAPLTVPTLPNLLPTLPGGGLDLSLLGLGTLLP